MCLVSLGKMRLRFRGFIKTSHILSASVEMLKFSKCWNVETCHVRGNRQKLIAGSWHVRRMVHAKALSVFHICTTDLFLRRTKNKRWVNRSDNCNTECISLGRINFYGIYIDLIKANHYIFFSGVWFMASLKNCAQFWGFRETVLAPVIWVGFRNRNRFGVYCLISTVFIWRHFLIFVLFQNGGG